MNDVVPSISPAIQIENKSDIEAKDENISISFDDIINTNIRTLPRVPFQLRLAVAKAWESSLRDVTTLNNERSWKRLFMFKAVLEMQERGGKGEKICFVYSGACSKMVVPALVRSVDRSSGAGAKARS